MLPGILRIGFQMLLGAESTHVSAALPVCICGHVPQWIWNHVACFEAAPHLTHPLDRRAHDDTTHKALPPSPLLLPQHIQKHAQHFAMSHVSNTLGIWMGTPEPVTQPSLSGQCPC
jgi:hypothetical protein